MCIRHYMRAKRHGGDPEGGQRHYRGTPRERCAVDGCSGVVEAKGFCQKHYVRLRRHGDVMAGEGSAYSLVVVERQARRRELRCQGR
jgi:hypothetical protein